MASLVTLVQPTTFIATSLHFYQTRSPLTWYNNISLLKLCTRLVNHLVEHLVPRFEWVTRRHSVATLKWDKSQPFPLRFTFTQLKLLTQLLDDMLQYRMEITFSLTCATCKCMARLFEYCSGIMKFGSMSTIYLLAYTIILNFNFAPRFSNSFEVNYIKIIKIYFPYG